MARSAQVRVGCSGWQYRHWRGDFYPRELPQSRWLEFYAERFDTVELNNSFYRLPDPSTFAAWRRRLPAGHVVAVKASRYLTHVKRLRDPADPLERFWSRARHLGERLGPVLYQVPPRWSRNAERLAAFLEALPDHAQAIEFRDADWYVPEIDRLLASAGIARCLHDMPGSAPRPNRVGPLVYVRFHGRGQRYGGRYSSQMLTAWAERLAGWARDGVPCYVYFNNEVGGHAVRDAARLRDLLGRRGVG